MAKQKLIVTQGLPASGKSTWAKEQVRNGNGSIVRVNRDDLRSMIDNSKWSRDREGHIIEIQCFIVMHYLGQNKTVIVDDTNFSKHSISKFKALAEKNTVEFEVKRFDTDLYTCIERNSKRDNPVPDRVIRDMYNKYVRKAPVYEEGNTVICDIDGTLAHMEGRSPYDGDKVDMDKVDLPIQKLLHTLSKEYNIVFVSGRDSKYWGKTIAWLKDHVDFAFDLRMRAENDNREDSIVKKEIYEQDIKNEYNVAFVLDDRDRVVKMWRDLGLKCLQVEYGDF